MRVYRIFVALAKSASEAETLNARMEVEAAARRKLADHPDLRVEVHTSDEVWKRVGPQDGGWAGWAKYVALGVNTITGQPNFDAIVLPWLGPFGPGKVGCATAQILRENSGRKPVRALSGGELHDVTGMIEINPRDFKSGWSLTVPSLE